MDSHSLEKLEFEQVKAILARYARCSLGKKLIANLQPTSREKMIRLWLDETDQMVDAIIHSDMPPLAGASDVADIVKRIEPGVAVEGEEFYRLGQTLRATHFVQQYIAGLPERLTHLHGLGERIGDFSSIACRIAEVVDAKGNVKDTASEKLLKIRTQMDDHRQHVRRILERMVKSPDVQRILQYANWTMQGDRMVLPVAANYRQQIPGIVHRSSDSGATLFIEPAAAVELNNQIVKLGQEAQQEIARIFWELSHLVHLNRDVILESLRGLARLDMLTAKASYARKRKLTKPIINKEGIVRLWQARHALLIELFEEDDTNREVVPIDVRLGDDFDVLVITGPNTGGKTVALKTVGLVAMMAQAGMFIPAGEGSTLPIFDDIFIDVGDEQSLQQSLSTFSAHLTQILRILKSATDRSLVLIDEMGAGTDPDEGAAIGQTVLDELLHRKTLTIASTHLSPLKAYAYRQERADNAAVEFDPKTLSATFRLLLGEPGNSNALIVAEHLGMPKDMLVTAQKYVSDQTKIFQEAINATISSRRAAEKARVTSQAAQQEAQDRQKELENKLIELHHQENVFQDWLAWINSLKADDKVYLKKFRREGVVVRMELHKQQALISLGRMSAEVPIKELSKPEQ